VCVCVCVCVCVFVCVFVCVCVCVCVCVLDEQAELLPIIQRAHAFRG